VKFSLREIGRIISIKIRNFKLWKRRKLINIRLPEGWYFFNSDNKELKRSSKTFFSVSERYVWAVGGWLDFAEISEQRLRTGLRTVQTTVGIPFKIGIFSRQASNTIGKSYLPRRALFFFQKNLGLGAASGLQNIVTFPPSAAYVSASRGVFLKDGFSAE